MNLRGRRTPTIRAYDLGVEATLAPRGSLKRNPSWNTPISRSTVEDIVRMPPLICSGAGSDVTLSTSRIDRMILGAKKMSKDGNFTNSSYKKNWSLTENAWTKLLQSLDDDPDEAGKKYEYIRLKLIKFFEWKNARAPEDLADETINRVARRIDEGVEIRAPDPTRYFRRVADLVAKEEFRGQKRWDRTLMEHEQHRERSSAPPEEADQRMGCLRACIAALPPEQRDLILRYHAVESKNRIPQRQELAHQLEIPLNALRIRACRIRAKLEECVEKCFEER